MDTRFRSRGLVLSTAFFIAFIGTVDTTYAQGIFDQYVSVPNNLPALTVLPETPEPSENGITLDLNGRRLGRCQCDRPSLNCCSPGRKG